MKKKLECPNRCDLTKHKMAPIGKAMQRMYHSLKIKCKYYDTCKKMFDLGQIEEHERKCNLPKCV